MDWGAKRLLYFLGLKGNLQEIATVAHPLLAVSIFITRSMLILLLTVKGMALLSI